MKTIGILESILGSVKDSYYKMFLPALEAEGFRILKTEIKQQVDYTYSFQDDVITVERKGIKIQLEGSIKGAQWRAVVRDKKGNYLFLENFQTIAQLPKKLDKKFGK